jgi:hypothetical protein
LLLCREAESAVHPVQETLFNQLRGAFGDSAVFFWNSRSGREIGLIWRPRVLQQTSFAVLACKDRAVIEAADSAEGSSRATATEANVPQLLSEMMDLSAGLLVQASEVSK